MGALAAIMFGVVLGAGVTMGDLDLAGPGAASAVAAIAGGVLYLLGLDGGRREPDRRLRLAGWVLFTAALLLPTSLLALQLIAVLAAAPAAFADPSTA